MDQTSKQENEVHINNLRINLPTAPHMFSG